MNTQTCVTTAEAGDATTPFPPHFSLLVKVKLQETCQQELRGRDLSVQCWASFPKRCLVSSQPEELEKVGDVSLKLRAPSRNKTSLGSGSTWGDISTLLCAFSQHVPTAPDSKHMWVMEQNLYCLCGDMLKERLNEVNWFIIIDSGQGQTRKKVQVPTWLELLLFYTARLQNVRLHTQLQTLTNAGCPHFIASYGGDFYVICLLCQGK